MKPRSIGALIARRFVRLPPSAGGPFRPDSGLRLRALATGLHVPRPRTKPTIPRQANRWPRPRRATRSLVRPREAYVETEFDFLGQRQNWFPAEARGGPPRVHDHRRRGPGGGARGPFPRSNKRRRARRGNGALRGFHESTGWARGHRGACCRPVLLTYDFVAGAGRAPVRSVLERRNSRTERNLPGHRQHTSTFAPTIFPPQGGGPRGALWRPRFQHLPGWPPFLGPTTGPGLAAPLGEAAFPE